MSTITHINFQGEVRAVTQVHRTVFRQNFPQPYSAWEKGKEPIPVFFYSDSTGKSYVVDEGICPVVFTWNDRRWVRVT